MTADDRRRIRQARDAAIRAQRLERIQAGDLETCSGCGCDTDLKMLGCDTCRNRHARRALWANDPEGQRAKERARKRRSRAKA